MESKILEPRINDIYTLAERTSVPHFLGFLTEDEQFEAIPVLNRLKAKYVMNGGYDNAQRKFLACLPDWCDSTEFPFKAFTFKYRNCDKLTHRDFLGSLMALGIKRESVGDILVEEGRAVAFIADDVSKFVKSQIEKIGRVGVEVTEGFTEPLPQQSELKQFTVTVASMRLDCVVGAFINSSRKTALEYIENSNVSVNSSVCEKAVKNIKNGDSITVRGKGKFFIDASDEVSKKGRIILKYSKYI